MLLAPYILFVDVSKFLGLVCWELGCGCALPRAIPLYNLHATRGETDDDMITNVCCTPILFEYELEFRGIL